MEKMTKKDKFIALREYIAQCDTENKDLFLETLDHEIELLEKKRSKPSKEDEQTKAFTAKVYTAVAEGDGVRASDLLFNSNLQAYAEEQGFPLRIQRITAALSKLSGGENAPILREVTKKVAYFRANPDYVENEDEGE